ncbi:hypothetical protein HanRHA438_Chr06g0274401 [Helianthus annuus]|nr:hypothetical protein HanRHA438_Chr06g0274401 [Helianthus annuus]
MAKAISLLSFTPSTRKENYPNNCLSSFVLSPFLSIYVFLSQFGQYLTLCLRMS